MAWWKKALLTLGLLAAWLCGLIFAGNYGYASQYFWLSGSALAIGFAVAPFWRFRSSNWYWPTAVVLALVHLAALYLERTFVAHRELPAKNWTRCQPHLCDRMRSPQLRHALHC